MSSAPTRSSAPPAGTSAATKAQSMRDNAKVLQFVSRIQDMMSSGAASAEVMTRAALILRPSNYDSVLVERSEALLCSFPRCPHTLPARSARERTKDALQAARARARGSARSTAPAAEEGVDVARYCSEVCAAASRAYRAVLKDEGVAGRDLSLPSSKTTAHATASAGGSGRAGRSAHPIDSVPLERAAMAKPVAPAAPAPAPVAAPAAAPAAAPVTASLPVGTPPSKVPQSHQPESEPSSVPAPESETEPKPAALPAVASKRKGKKEPPAPVPEPVALAVTERTRPRVRAPAGATSVATAASMSKPSPAPAPAPAPALAPARARAPAPAPANSTAHSHGGNSSSNATDDDDNDEDDDEDDENAGADPAEEDEEPGWVQWMGMSSGDDDGENTEGAGTDTDSGFSNRGRAGAGEEDDDDDGDAWLPSGAIGGESLWKHLTGLSRVLATVNQWTSEDSVAVLKGRPFKGRSQSKGGQAGNDDAEAQHPSEENLPPITLPNAPDARLTALKTIIRPHLASALSRVRPNRAHAPATAAVLSLCDAFYGRFRRPLPALPGGEWRLLTLALLAAVGRRERAAASAADTAAAAGAGDDKERASQLAAVEAIWPSLEDLRIVAEEAGFTEDDLRSVLQAVEDP